MEIIKEKTDKHASETTYADIVNRAVTFFLDLMLASILFVGLMEVISLASWSIDSAIMRNILFFLMLFFYFNGFMASRLKTTPAKRLSGFYIIRLDGKPLTIWQVGLRTMMVLATFFSVMTIISASFTTGNKIISVIGLLLLLIPIFNSRNQALHDILLGTVVLKKGIRSASEEKNAVVIERQQWNWSRIGRVIGSLVFITMVLGLLYVAGAQSHFQDRFYRVNYALTRANELKPIVEEFHANHGRFPKDVSEIDANGEIAYPAGGGCRISQEGNIKIWFDVLPDLKKGEIRLTPKLHDKGKIQWKCRATGEALTRYSSSWCQPN